MKKILALLIAVMLTGGAQASDVLEYKKQLTRYAVWVEACLYTQYSCIGLAVPKVEYLKMRKNLLGRYSGGDTVFINKDLGRLQTHATMYHEMVHYLQTYVGGLMVPGPAFEICMAEDEAFAETDKRWVRMGMPERQRGDTWWKPYEHCRQFYDPDYTPSPIGWGWLWPMSS